MRWNHYKPKCTTCNDQGIILRSVNPEMSDFAFRCDCEAAKNKNISPIIPGLEMFHSIQKKYEKPVMRDNQPTEAEA